MSQGLRKGVMIKMKITVSSTTTTTTVRMIIMEVIIRVIAIKVEEEANEK